MSHLCDSTVAGLGGAEHWTPEHYQKIFLGDMSHSKKLMSHSKEAARRILLNFPASNPSAEFRHGAPLFVGDECTTS